MKSIAFPDSVKEIGCDAFYSSGKLESITIPGSLESLRADLFLDCSRSWEVRVAGEMENLKMVDGVLFHKETTHVA